MSHVHAHNSQLRPLLIPKMTPFTSIADTILSIIGLMLSIYLNSVYVEHLRCVPQNCVSNFFLKKIYTASKTIFKESIFFLLSSFLIFNFDKDYSFL